MVKLDGIKIVTKRLLLVPFTEMTAAGVLEGREGALSALGLLEGADWPDDDTIKLLPRMIRILKSSPFGFGSWMIARRDTKTVIGDAGFKGGPVDGKIDIGYSIIVKERRAGYGFEAAKALLDWALSRPGVKNVTASCDRRNAGSRRILEKLGMRIVSENGGVICWQSV